MGDKTLIIYVALCCVNHDHVNYGPGQTGGLDLALSQEQAAPLLAVGAIKVKDAADAVVAPAADPSASQDAALAGDAPTPAPSPAKAPSPAAASKKK